MKWIVNPTDGRWRVRIGGQDVAEVILTDAQVCPFRAQLVTVAGTEHVELALAMHLEGTLVTVVPD